MDGKKISYFSLNLQYHVIAVLQFSLVFINLKRATVLCFCKQHRIDYIKCLNLRLDLEIVVFIAYAFVHSCKIPLILHISSHCSNICITYKTEHNKQKQN